MPDFLCHLTPAFNPALAEITTLNSTFRLNHVACLCCRTSTCLMFAALPRVGLAHDLPGQVSSRDLDSSC